MHKNSLYPYGAALLLFIVASSAGAQLTEDSSPESMQANPATSFDFTNPFGVVFGRSTCAELAASLRQTTWEKSAEGGSFFPVMFDSPWVGRITVINSCFSPRDTIENLDVTFYPGYTSQPEGGANRALLSAFADRMTAKGSDWQLIYKNISDPVSPRIVVYNPNASVSVQDKRDFVFVTFRSHRFNLSRQAEIERALVRPVGVAVGISTCYEASIQLDSKPSLKRNEHKINLLGRSTTIAMDSIEVTAKNPGRFYPGATSIEAVCDDLDDRVATLYVGVKDEPNNSAARNAYGVLASKYKRVEGAQIPEKGEGYARFEASGVMVELKAWGNGQDFLVTYMESKGFDRIRKFRDQRRQAL